MADTTLILTRPAQSAARFLAALSAQARAGITPVVSPLIEIVPIPLNTNMIDMHTSVIFTSANAVSAGPDGQGRRAYCVGRGTTQAAAARGWRAEEVGQTADELVAALGARPTSGPLVHLAGTHRRGNVAERLSAMDYQVTVCEVYDQRLLTLSDVALDALKGPSIVPLFSPRTAAQFAAQTDDLSKAHVVAMSRAVARPLEGRSLAALHVLDAPTREDMMEFVEKLCLGTSLP